MSRKKDAGWTEIDATDGKPLLPAPECKRWFVATCGSHQEAAAVGALARHGHVAWFPQMTRWIIKSTKAKQRVKLNRALFPGYLFVAPNLHCDRGLTECGRWLKWLAGDHLASEIPARIVRRLSDDQQRGNFIDWRGAPDRPTREHVVGSVVKVESGPFAHFDGIVEKTAKDRILVLLSVFGRATRVEMASGDALKVA